MSAPVLRFRSSDDLTELSSLTFSALLPGTPSAAQVVHLWNNFGDTGAETSRNARLVVSGRVSGATDYVASGIDLLDSRAVRVEVIGGSGPSGVYLATGLQGVGAGVVFDLPDIPNNEAAYLSILISPPANSSTESIELLFDLVDERSVALAEGVFEAAGAGIRLALGDGSRSFFVSGGTATPNGPADDKVDFGDIVYQFEGFPVALLAAEVTFSNLDGAAAALGAGEGYYALVSYGAAGRTITKGAKATLPLGVEDEPTAPAGELVRQRILRTDDATIEAADIETRGILGAFAATRSSGLTQYVGAGEAISGPFRVRTTEELSIDLPASDVSVVFLLPSTGTLESTVDGSRPDPRALELMEATTGVATVTAVRDLRQLQNQAATIASLFLPAPVANDVAYWANPFATPLYLRPVRPASLFLVEPDPSALSYTGSNWKVEIEKLSGGSWVSFFPSSGTDDRRPSIAFDATSNLDVDAFPEDFTLPAGELLRVRVVNIPTGPGTPSAGLLVVLPFEPSR